jgi:hypothetical protein
MVEYVECDTVESEIVEDEIISEELVDEVDDSVDTGGDEATFESEKSHSDY